MAYLSILFLRDTCRCLGVLITIMLLISDAVPPSLAQLTAQTDSKEKVRDNIKESCQRGESLIHGLVKRIDPEQVHSFRIHLGARQTLRVEFDQQDEPGRPGVDIKISLYDPSGQAIVVGSDRPDYRGGSEPMSLVTDVSGDYCFVIESVDQSSGSYRIRYEPPRVEQEGDRRRIDLERKFVHAWLVSATSAHSTEDFSATLAKANKDLKEVMAERGSLAHPEIYFIALAHIARNYIKLNQVGEAISLFDKEFAANKDAWPPMMAARFYLIKGEVLVFGREYDKGQEAFDAAAIIMKNASPESLFNLLASVGEMYYMAGRPKTALRYYERLLELIDPGRTDESSRSRASLTHNWVGMSAWALGDAERALESYKRAEAVENNEPKTSNYPVTLNNLAVANLSLERFDDALYYTDLQLEYAKGRDEQGVVWGMINKGLINAQLGYYTDAESYYNEAIPKAKELKNRAPESIMRDPEAFLYHNLGVLNEDRGLRDNARDLFGRALDLRRGREPREEAQTRMTLGRLEVETGNPRLALDEHFKIAIELLAQGGYGRDIAILHSLRALALNGLGRRAEAGQAFEESVKQLHAMGRGHYEDVAEYLWGVAERSNGNLDAALMHARRSIKLIEDRRAEVTGRYLLAGYLAARQKPFDLAIDVLYKKYLKDKNVQHVRDAFELHEQSHARTLLDTLAESFARNTLGLGRDEDFRRLADERRALIRKQAEGNIPDRDATVARLRFIEAELDRSYSAKLASHPRYQRFASPATLNEIQSTLPDGSILFEYRIMNDGSLLWAVTKDSVSAFPLPKRAAIKVAVNRLVGDVRARGNQFLSRKEIAAKEADYPEAAAAVSTMLLQPAAGLMRGKKRIFIVADGVLQLLPFAAVADPTSLREPLIAHYELISLASATSLVRLDEIARSRPRPLKDLALFSYPASRRGVAADQDGRTGAGLCVTRTRLSLPELAFAGNEIRRLKKIFPVKRLDAFGPRANRNLLLDEELKHYRYIHVIAHAYFDYLRPTCSGIFLSPVDTSGKALSDQGVVAMTDLYDASLAADLVTLSACDTAVGEMLPGEGVVGLTRGLLFAGALRVMSSRWTVVDRIAPDFMDSFYRDMRTPGFSTAGALAEAQRKMWKKGISPYYWAGFTLEGLW